MSNPEAVTSPTITFAHLGYVGMVLTAENGVLVLTVSFDRPGNAATVVFRETEDGIVNSQYAYDDFGYVLAEAVDGWGDTDHEEFHEWGTHRLAEARDRLDEKLAELLAADGIQHELLKA